MVGWGGGLGRGFVGGVGSGGEGMGAGRGLELRKEVWGRHVALGLFVCLVAKQFRKCWRYDHAVDKLQFARMLSNHKKTIETIFTKMQLNVFSRPTDPVVRFKKRFYLPYCRIDLDLAKVLANQSSF